MNQPSVYPWENQKGRKIKMKRIYTHGSIEPTPHEEFKICFDCVKCVDHHPSEDCRGFVVRSIEQENKCITLGNIIVVS